MHFSTPLFSKFLNFILYNGPLDRLYKMMLPSADYKNSFFPMLIHLNSHLLESKKWHLLIFMYLITSDVERNFVCLLAICISFIHGLFMAFDHFSLEHSLSILEMLFYYLSYVANNFSVICFFLPCRNI